MANPTKILYVNPMGVSGPIMELLVWGGHEVTCVGKLRDTLDMIGTRHFSALLIAEEIEDSEGDLKSDADRRKPTPAKQSQHRGRQHQRRLHTCSSPERA
jgi:hypothetical protein